MTIHRNTEAEDKNKREGRLAASYNGKNKHRVVVEDKEE